MVFETLERAHRNDSQNATQNEKQVPSKKDTFNALSLMEFPTNIYQLNQSNCRFKACLMIFFTFTQCRDPDQTPHSMTSDLGLHCLPMSTKMTLGS